MTQNTNSVPGKEKKTSEALGSSKDTECGLCCHPAVLQKCAILPCFVFSYGLCAFISQSLNVYISSQITSIEKQFGLSGTQTGFLLSCSDISFLICVLFTSHFFGKGRIPKYLGLVTIVFGISGIICALPHLILGVKDDGIPGSSINDGGVCQLESNTSANVSKDCSNVGGGSYTNTAVTLLVIGIFIQGFSKSPRTALVSAYIDNNVADPTKSGAYIGFTTAVALLGPSVAVGLGGVFSSMYVTLEDVNIKTTDPRWIGAWWLGFIVFGIIAIIVGIPVCFYPKRLPRKSKYQNEYTDDQKEDATSGTKDSIKDVFVGFLKVMKTLTTNCVFVLVVVGTGLKMLGFSGFIFLGPKYIEKHFMKPAWIVNLAVGGLSMVSVFSGSLTGGCLTTRLKLTRKGILKMINIASVVVCLCLIIMMFLSCDQPSIDKFDEIQNPSNTTVLYKQGTDEICRTGCGCSSENYLPVCGNDTNFYSACFAGCTNKTDEGFSDCACIGSNETATLGFCDTSCATFIPYCVVLAIMGFSTTVQVAPIYVLLMRSVDVEQKPSAVGMNTLMNTLIGWLPGPILFGLIFDSTCLVWNENCNQRGACALNQLDSLRLYFHALSLAASFLGFILTLAALIKLIKSHEKSVNMQIEIPGVMEMKTK